MRREILGVGSLFPLGNVGSCLGSLKFSNFCVYNFDKIFKFLFIQFRIFVKEMYRPTSFEIDTRAKRPSCPPPPALGPDFVTARGFAPLSSLAIPPHGFLYHNSLILRCQGRTNGGNKKWFSSFSWDKVTTLFTDFAWCSQLVKSQFRRTHFLSSTSSRLAPVAD
jgi:hypothetical protein